MKKKTLILMIVLLIAISLSATSVFAGTCRTKRNVRYQTTDYVVSTPVVDTTTVNVTNTVNYTTAVNVTSDVEYSGGYYGGGYSSGGYTGVVGHGVGAQYTQCNGGGSCTTYYYVLADDCVCAQTYVCGSGESDDLVVTYDTTSNASTDDSGSLSGDTVEISNDSSSGSDEVVIN